MEVGASVIAPSPAATRVSDVEAEMAELRVMPGETPVLFGSIVVKLTLGGVDLRCPQ